MFFVISFPLSQHHLYACFVSYVSGKVIFSWFESCTDDFIVLSMTAGGIGAWNKKVGDEIQPGDVLVEIETDKAQMDFECQEEGFLAKVLVDTGAKDVAVGQVN